MGAEIRLGLRLIQTQYLEPKEPAEFYDAKFKIKQEMLGIKYDYVLCPQTALKDFSQSQDLNTNNQLGICIKEDEKNMVFVSQNLHYAQIPIVGLLIHLNGLSRKELVKIIENGEELLKNKTPEEISLTTCHAVFDHAASMLRSQEFNDLVEKFREDEQFSPGVIKKVCEHITEIKHNKIEKKTNTLPVLRENLKTREEYYRTQLEKYNHAFEQNKWTKKSKQYQAVLEQLNFGQSQLNDGLSIENILQPFIVDSEELAQELIRKYGDNIETIVFFLDQLVQILEQGKHVKIEKDASSIVYDIEYHYKAKLGKEPPLKFKKKDNKGKDINMKNIVEKGDSLKRFYKGLRQRLSTPMFKKMEEIQGILKKMPELTAEIASNRQFGDVVREYVSELLAPLNKDDVSQQFLLIPVNDISTIIEKQLVKYLDALAQTATQQPENDTKLLSLLEARKIIGDTGESTESIDKTIYQLTNEVKRRALKSG